ncbi:MAG: leucine-rich repeat domain-containing protein [Ruminococcus sp.]|jgi:hypothetical protein
MKKILCALLACMLCASVSIGLSGCGCSNNSSQEPGYKVTATEPDLTNDEFGFFILNKDEVMITKYTGSGKDVKIPESYENYKVTVLGRSLFNGKDISSVEIPDTVKEIQDYAFSSNRNLKSVKLPKNLETIGTNAFFNCSSLESIELPASLKEIGVYAFSAAGLKSVTIPESKTLTTLDQYVFFQCQELTEVTLPSTITSIAENTFADCPNKITINAPKGSYAISYAKTNKFDYKEV